MPDPTTTATTTTTTTTTTTPQQPKPPQPKGLIAALAVFFIVLTVYLLYLLFQAWPAGTNEIDFIFCTKPLTNENRIMLMVILGGAIGAMIHVTSSFAAFVGNREFRKSWLLWYVMRPLQGSTLALIFYVVLRAGILSMPVSTETGKTDTASAAKPSAVVDITGLAGKADSLRRRITAGVLAFAGGDTTRFADSLAKTMLPTKPAVAATPPKEATDVLNPFGILAVAFLVGMFSKKASDKLEDVFSTMFNAKERPPLTDKLDPHEKEKAKVGSDTAAGQPVGGQSSQAVTPAADPNMDGILPDDDGPENGDDNTPKG